MFSFLKRLAKPRVTSGDHGAKLASELTKLRSELSDDTMSEALDLIERLEKLQCVDLPTIEALLDLTDQASDIIMEAYEEYQDRKITSIEVLSMSLVATGIKLSKLPEHEKDEAIDIYLDRITESFIQFSKAIEKEDLKNALISDYVSYYPHVVRAIDNMFVHSDEATVALVADVDRTIGLERDEIHQAVAAIKIKTALCEVMLGIARLAPDLDQ